VIIRTKSGDFKAENSAAMLDFLGIEKEAAGTHEVKGDIEVVASVPFRLSADVESGQGFPWTLSTFDLDLFGERIDPKGWDLKNYVKNPVVLWAHRHDIPAIGKCESITVDDGGLHGVLFFNDKSFDFFGWSIGQRVKAGVIRACSVGFRPLEIEIPSKQDRQGGTSLIFRKQLLGEVSACNLPANPKALVEIEEAIKIDTKQETGCPNFWGGFIFNTEGV